MAYDRKKIFQQAKEAVVKHNLYFIEDIVAFLPIAKKTYYEYFPIDSNESNELRELLEENKIKTKASIRVKLHNSDKAAELLALYRLLATPEEHQKLNQSYIDHTTKGKEINMPISNWADGNTDTEV